MPTTTFMLLVLPTPGTTNDFTGETQLMTAFGLIDTHDHSPGYGVKVPTAGLNINADLPFAGFNASGLRSVRLNSQGSTLALLLDTNALYASGGNLYFNNGSGQAVQITSGATLSASSIGGISGLAAPASVAYAGGSYVFTSNTNKAAIVDMGPIIIRDTGTSALGITLQSPTGLAGAYAITLPAALPGSTLPLVLSAAGLMSAAQLTTAQLSASAGIVGGQIAAATVGRSNMIAVGQQVSSSSGTFSSASASFVDVTNLTVTITTTGRPVMLILQPDGSATAAQITNTSAVVPVVSFNRAGSAIALFGFGGVASANYSNAVYLDAVGAGTYTYKVQVATGGAGTVFVQRFVLMAYEL